MDWLLKDFLFLVTISVTDSEVIAFYMRAEASFDADKAPASLRELRKRWEQQRCYEQAAAKCFERTQRPGR